MKHNTRKAFAVAALAAGALMLAPAAAYAGGPHGGGKGGGGFDIDVTQACSMGNNTANGNASLIGLQNTDVGGVLNGLLSFGSDFGDSFECDNSAF
ncbi:hypothetical protein KZ829_13735 [Actinoplanes hulinensis]|uniref:Secreted protein n=1 Tax=Actinoplanes hulinensis TaxID=1144547 RepID=A0ABS7B196_9ACTN|nr:hypothetical protein [Actinoplanes hulinensis]MBW6434800.1 hypothetical protein [Actinoplanes hulinensis]